MKLYLGGIGDVFIGLLLKLHYFVSNVKSIGMGGSENLNVSILRHSPPPPPFVFLLINLLPSPPPYY